MRATRRRRLRNSNGSRPMSLDSEHLRGMRLTRRDGVTGLLALVGCGAVRPAQAAEPTHPWPVYTLSIFNGRQLADGGNLATLEMPNRAEDAAIVPVTLRANLPAGDTRAVKAVTLVIDQNPAPVAATFQLGSGVAMISTRVRIDSYTNVHAVAE